MSDVDLLGLMQMDEEEGQGVGKLDAEEVLGRIGLLAARQVQLEREVAEAEESLKRKKSELRQVQELDLPNAMAEVGMKEFTLQSGEKISVKIEYYASISKERQGEAFRWLRENGHGSLIKSEVKVAYPKGQESAASALREELQKKGLPAEQGEAVNGMTLKAWVREMSEGGRAVPQDLFGVFMLKRSVVKKTGER